jgi:hypothetical protein
MPLRWEDVPHVDPADFTLATVPALFAEQGDPGAGIDEAVASLEALLELSARHEAEGQGDAPWPPHYRKQEGEPPRVQPSKRRAARTDEESADSGAGPQAPAAGRSPTGRRRSTKPLIEIGRAARKEDALAGLERWKARHPEAAAHLQPADVLVDAMRGRSTTWTRIRVNLEHVPVGMRPAQEPPDPDYDPWVEWAGDGRRTTDRAGRT